MGFVMLTTGSGAKKMNNMNNNNHSILVSYWMRSRRNHAQGCGGLQSQLPQKNIVYLNI